MEIFLRLLIFVVAIWRGRYLSADKGRLKESVVSTREVIFTIKQLEMTFKAIEFAKFSKSQELLNANWVNKFLQYQWVWLFLQTHHRR
jgi:hypothetical protein